MARFRLAGYCAVAGVLLLSAPVASLADPLVLTSPNFTDGGKLPVKHAGALKTNPNCVGENVSPAFAWNDPPEGTKSFAFVVYDPDGGRGLGVYHWVAYGIAADRRSFAEGDVGQPPTNLLAAKIRPASISIWGRVRHRTPASIITTSV